MFCKLVTRVLHNKELNNVDVIRYFACMLTLYAHACTHVEHKSIRVPLDMSVTYRPTII